MKRDHVRPTREEADDAARAIYAHLAGLVVRPRPRFIQQVMDTSESDRWTYFIGTKSSAIKIGAAGCVKERLKALQAHSPVALQILAKVRGGEALEGAYHSWFAAHRLHGEWFEPHADILAEIARLSPERVAGEG